MSACVLVRIALASIVESGVVSDSVRTGVSVDAVLTRTPPSPSFTRRWDRKKWYWVEYLDGGAAAQQNHYRVTLVLPERTIFGDGEKLKTFHSLKI